MRLSARTMIFGVIGLAVAGMPIVTTTQVAAGRGHGRRFDVPCQRHHGWPAG